MYIVHHPPGTAAGIVDQLVASGLVYGDTINYSSLVSPCSVALAEHELSELTRDLVSFWHLYDKLNELYEASLLGQAAPWIAKLVECGLSPAEVTAHRITARAGLVPRMCRVDYVSLGDNRKVAEVQWKSGGPGLFFGFADVLGRLLPLDGHHSIGNPIDKFAKIIHGNRNSSAGVALNAVRSTWLRSEEYLKRELALRGIGYQAFDRLQVSQHLSVSENGVLWHADDRGAGLLT